MTETRKQANDRITEGRTVTEGQEINEEQRTAVTERQIRT